MRRFSTFICLLFLISPIASIAQSQSSTPPMDGRSRAFTSLRDRSINLNLGWDIGLNVGSSHSLADIGGTRDHSRILFFDTQWKASGLNLGVFGRYRFNELLALNTEFNYARISGADTLSPVTSSRYNRRASFDNNIYELAFKGEVYVPKYYLNIPVEIYAYIGLGMFYHDPQITVPNPETFQSGSFSKVQPVVPMGLGLHYTFPNNFRIGYNIGWRKTFTDHMDMVSTKSSQGNDSYFFNAFNVGYYFKVKD